MIVDFQQHYTPPELLKGNRDAVSVQLDEYGNPSYLLNPLLADLGAHVRMMDRAGIDAGVLTCGAGFDQPDLTVCRLINDRMKQAVTDYPGRFIGLAHVPALKPVEATAEMKRCAVELGFPGVAIGSEVQGQALDSEALRPFWRAAADLGLYVFIHPLPNVIKWEHMHADDLGRMLGWQFSLMVAAVRMINSRPARRVAGAESAVLPFRRRHRPLSRPYPRASSSATNGAPLRYRGMGASQNCRSTTISNSGCSTTAPAGPGPITPPTGARNGSASGCRRYRCRRPCSRPTIRRRFAIRTRSQPMSPPYVRSGRTPAPWSMACLPSGWCRISGSASAHPPSLRSEGDSHGTDRLHRARQYGAADGAKPAQGRAHRHRIRHQQRRRPKNSPPPAGCSRLLSTSPARAPRRSSPCCQPARRCARSI